VIPTVLSAIKSPLGRGVYVEVAVPCYWVNTPATHRVFVPGGSLPKRAFVSKAGVIVRIFSKRTN
jgi:hypothetical protein